MAVQCSAASCDKCTSVDPSGCVQCATGYYTTGVSELTSALKACVKCSDTIVECVLCANSTALTCSDCNIGFRPNTGQTACVAQTCVDTNCIDCPVSDSSCDTCANGFLRLTNATCKNICGDNIKVAGE